MDLKTWPLLLIILIANVELTVSTPQGNDVGKQPIVLSPLYPADVQGIVQSIHNLEEGLKKLDSNLHSVVPSLKADISKLSIKFVNVENRMVQLSEEFRNSANTLLLKAQEYHEKFVELKFSIGQLDQKLNALVRNVSEESQIRSKREEMIMKEISTLRSHVQVVTSSLYANISSNVAVLTYKLNKVDADLSTLAKESRARLTALEEKKSFPVGFVYMQLSPNPSPNIIFPDHKWEEVTREYAGQFFRAEGGNSSKFGVIQADNTRRVNYVESLAVPSQPSSQRQGQWGTIIVNGTVVTSSGNIMSHRQYLPAGGRNEPLLWTGSVSGWPNNKLGVAFYSSSGEIRPINQAVRIWKVV